MKKTHWNTDAQPYDATLDQVLYDIRRSDGGEGLLLDAVTTQEIIEDADGELAFDALVTPYAKLERRMELLRTIMERTGDKVKPVALQIVGPFKQRSVANVAAVFELSDGQTLTIFFHNPDVTPNKMAPADEVISWKWLLNKKDVTIVVAPERGADLNVREVARRIIRLAEKNSPAFQRVNATRAARMQSIQSLKDEIANLEAELETVQRELEVAKVVAEDAAVAQEEKSATKSSDITYRNSADGLFTSFFPNTAEGEKAWNIINATPGAEGGKVLVAHAETTIAQLKAAGYTVIEGENTPITPEEDVALLKKLEEDEPSKNPKEFAKWWEGSAGTQYAAVYLLGKSRGNDYLVLTEQAGEYLAHIKRGSLGRERVGTPSGIVEWLRTDVFVGMGDAYASKSLTVDDVRAKLNLVKGEDILFGNASQEIVERPSAEQELIDAYIRSFGEATAALNAALSAVNWEGITDNAAAHEELEKLNVALRESRHNIIEKASSDLESGGINKGDKRLSGLRNEAGFRAWSDALDALQATRDKIRVVAKERIIAKGEEEVAALTEESPLSDVAAALFHKEGIDTGGYTPQIVTAIENKDAALAWSILCHPENKVSAEIFERATGIKLAKKQRELRLQIDAWGGITPEQRAEIETQKTEARVAKARDDNLKWAWNGLASIRVRNSSNGIVSNGQDYLTSLFINGFDEIVVRKRGAASAYYMRNAEDKIASVKSKNFNGFLKAALAVGSLRQALELLGAIDAQQEEKSDAEKIATVDDAYHFSSATDEFKLWLADSVLKKGASPFLTAKNMDEAAKRHGAEIEWGEFVGAAIDSVHRLTGNGKELVVSLDDVGHAVTSLQQALETTLESDVANSIKEAITILTETDYEPNESEIGVTFDVETALDSAAAFEVETEVRGLAATKTLLKDFSVFLASDEKFAPLLDSVHEVVTFDSALTPLRAMMSCRASLHGVEMTQEESARMDAFAIDARAIGDRLTGRLATKFDTNTALDGIDDSRYVGKIRKGERVVGRIDIADDGKAMVYVGESGNERASDRSGNAFMYSDDDAPKMVESLFISEESPTVQSAYFVGPAKDRMDALKVLTDTSMNRWMPEAQSKTVIAGLMGEEWQFFADKMKELAGVIADMPKTYDQDGKGEEAVAYLHYFRGTGDWYITERDMEGVGTEQAFGLADLYGDGGELGYISINELVAAGVELDFHFTPKTIGQIRGGDIAASEDQPQQGAVDEPDASAEQKNADRALLQSVIDGTVSDILAPDLADSLEAAFNRNQGDADMVNLFELAVGAYQNAMLAATANL